MKTLLIVIVVGLCNFSRATPGISDSAADLFFFVYRALHAFSSDFRGDRTEDFMTFGPCKDPESQLKIPIYSNDPQLIQSMHLTGLELVFNKIAENSALTTSRDISISVNLPQSLNSTEMFAVFKGVKAEMDMKLPVAPVSHTMATMKQNSFAVAVGDAKTGKISMDLVQVKMDGSENPDGFGEFLRVVTFAPGGSRYPFRMTGRAVTRMDFEGRGQKLNDVCLGNIPFDVVIDSITGLGGLSEAKVLGVPEIVEGTRDFIKLKLKMSLYNPSNVKLSMGRIKFHMIYDGSIVGSVIVPDATIGTGWTSFEDGIAYYQPDQSDSKALEAGIRMLSAFSSGIDGKVSVFGHLNSSNINALRPSLQQVRIETELPSPKNQPLIQKAFFGFPNLFNRKAKTDIIAFNPFQVPVTITRIKAKMYIGKVQLGDIDQEIQGFTIAAGQSLKSPVMTLKCRISLGSIKAIWNSLFKDILVTVESEMIMKVQEYETKLLYRQENVATHFNK